MLNDHVGQLLIHFDMNYMGEINFFNSPKQLITNGIFSKISSASMCTKCYQTICSPLFKCPPSHFPRSSFDVIRHSIFLCVRQLVYIVSSVQAIRASFTSQPRCIPAPGSPSPSVASDMWCVIRIHLKLRETVNGEVEN